MKKIIRKFVKSGSSKIGDCEHICLTVCDAVKFVETWKIFRVAYYFFTMTESKCSCQTSLPTTEATKRHLAEHNNVLQSHFPVGSLNYEKRLLASTLLVVCLSVRMEQLVSQWRGFHER